MKKRVAIGPVAAAFMFLILDFDSAHALPSFARQTGLDCTACHTMFPELTQTGRAFKLRGYTMGGGTSKMPIPLSAMVMADTTKSSDATGMPKDSKLVIPQISLFYGGKIIDRLGAFVQVTYDGTELPDNKDIAHHVAMDNMDIRYADALSLGGKELVYGLTANNNPTMSDLWNSTPVWGFPYASSAIANTPSAATLIDGGLGQKVGGIGAYAMWNDLLYIEAAIYGSAKRGGVMGVFGWKNPDLEGDAAVLDGTAPYARVALEHTFGNHDIMVGGYGMTAKINPALITNTSGERDKYYDRALDAEYQYTGGSSIVTATATRIWEEQHLDASAAIGAADKSNHTLDTTKAKVSYYYDQKYGATLGYFATSGTTDAAEYGTYGTLPPDSEGEIAEIDYVPWRYLKLSLQYTMYSKFDGARKNYDGAGRNASDNDNIYALAWLAF
jgi:hypothetical protein